MKIYILLLTTLLILNCSISPDDIQNMRSRNGYWLYQLQDFNPENTVSGSFKYIVIDYSSDGTEAGRYSAAQISQVKLSGAIVLSYISIGEAESYRYYWQSDWTNNPPVWLGKENPGWEGNYKVEYRHPEWQAIIFGYIDKIIEAGFDGIYMDIIDAYEYWADSGNNEGFYTNISTTAMDMIEFVKNIAVYCENKGTSNFLIFPQNGENILEYDTDGSYLTTISGIGVEDVFYNGIVKRTRTEIDYRLDYLSRITLSRKPVISVEYIDTSIGLVGRNLNRISDFLQSASNNGFIPYIARDDRKLDEINMIEGLQP